MALPDFNANGDLPPGIHRATIDEVVARFGGPGYARQQCTRNLRHILELAQRTGNLERLIIFGSYVSDKLAPNDVDVILVMNESFHPDEAPIEAVGLFIHSIAQTRFGASVFWIKPTMAIGEPLDDFIAHWQFKRDDSLRGIVEVIL
jgi:hypothetical protein